MIALVEFNPLVPNSKSGWLEISFLDVRSQYILYCCLNNHDIIQTNNGFIENDQICRIKMLHKISEHIISYSVAAFSQV